MSFINQNAEEDLLNNFDASIPLATNAPSSEADMSSQQWQQQDNLVSQEEFMNQAAMRNGNLCARAACSQRLPKNNPKMKYCRPACD
jgi:hypothetical protein